MSISTVLIPLAIALAASVPGSLLLAFDAARDGGDPSGAAGVNIGQLPTPFCSASLLCKTLREHGLPVAEISGMHVVSSVANVELHYTRQLESEPFMLELRGVRDPAALRSELECFEREYRENVQTYTYDKLVQSLATNRMTVETETVLPDNSILITVDIG